MGALFGYWTIILLGLLWVKRTTGGLRCNAFSAAIAAAVFVGLYAGCCYLVLSHLDQINKYQSVAVFMFMAFGLIPTVSGLTLLFGHHLIPFFSVEKRQLERLTAYLTGWTFVSLIVVSMLQILGFLLIAALFGGGRGTGRRISRVSDGEYYYW